MSIRFKCACGRELDVPDEDAGREALCPGCRKSVPVPEEPDLSGVPGGDEREASEFKPGALASLLNGNSPTAAPESDVPAAPKPAASVRREERAQEARAIGDSIPAPESKERNPAARTGQSQYGPESEKPEGTPRDEVPPEQVKVDKADETRGVTPPGVEILPDKIKFRCKCGQKVAVRVPAPQGAGRCPRCKRTLTVPSIPGVTDRQQRSGTRKRAKTSARELRHCVKCGRRIEDPNAAFCPRCGSPLENQRPAWQKRETDELPAGDPEAPAKRDHASPAPEPSREQRRQSAAREAADRAANLLRPPSRMEVPQVGSVPELAVAGRPAGLGRRLGVFLLDSLATGGVAVVAYFLASRAGLQAARLPSVLAAVGAFAVINEAIFAALSGGRSLGMLVTGVGVRNHEGRPAGLLLLLVRLVASLLLLIGAPLAIIDSQRRTLHDIVCGTTVRRLIGA